MKKLVCLALALGMMTAAFSCGQDEDADTSAKTSVSEKDETEDTSAEETKEVSEEETEPETEEETEKETEKEPEETTGAAGSDGIDVLPVYAQAMSHIYYAAEEPLSGYDLSDPDYMISDDEFAVFDVDKDGTDELIFLHTATCMAGMVGYVYGVDENGELYEKLGSAPFMHFYSNGLITVDDSHNQGVSGSFWPHSVCQYNAETGVYEWIYYVSAWDKEEFPENYYTNEKFPDEADTSGSGFVYYIYETKPEDDGRGEPDPVDVTVYDEWYDTLFGSAKEEKPIFYNVTEDNIQSVLEDGYVG
jgi:hypothetical protein